MKSLSAWTHPLFGYIARQKHRAQTSFWHAWDAWIVHPQRETRLKTARNSMLVVALGFFGLGGLVILGFAQATQPNPTPAMQNWTSGDKILTLGALGLMLAITWQLFNRGLDAWIPQARVERWEDPRMIEVEQDMLRAGLKLPLLLTPLEWMFAPHRPSKDKQRRAVAITLEATLPQTTQASAPRARL